MATNPGDPSPNRAAIVANTAAIFVPAVWLGGVTFSAQIAFVILACIASWIAIQHGAGGTAKGASSSRRVKLRISNALLFLASLSVVTTLWVLPLPPALHALCFPKLTALRAELLPPESLESWYPVSLAPGQTLAEAARLGALAILFFSCRQVSRASVWYAVFLSGSLVALIGLVQFILGVDRILGLYVPMDQPPDEYRPVAVLLGTFVNPNHQAGLFLVSLGAGAALIRRSLSKLRGLERPAGRDLSDLAIGNILVALIAVALMLTYSRAGMTMLGALVLVSVLSFLKSGAFKGTTAALLCLPVAALLALFAWSRVNFSVSWSELATLTTPEGHDKLRVLLEHRNLLPFSHALGLGRGSISSLLPLTSTIPSGRTMTHVESMPIVLVLEYGAVLGSVILIGVLTWFVRAFRARHDASSTLILATLAAICCQNFVDFNLEFSGVTASAVALAATVTPSHTVRLRTRRARNLAVVSFVLVGVFLTASAWYGGSWARQRRIAARVQAGGTTIERALRQHPFDARLHLYAAKAAIERRDIGAAKRFAGSARRLEPAAIDAHLVAAQIEQFLGNPRAARRAYATALGQLAFPPTPGLTAYLAKTLSPEELATVAPSEDVPFFHLANALLEQHPGHVMSITRRRAFQAVPDADALALRVRAAIRLNKTLLATTEALHFVRVRPTDPRPYQLYARAIRLDPSPARERTFQTMLRQALENATAADEVLRLLLLESLLTTRERAEIRATLERLERATDGEQLADRRSIRWRAQLLERARRVLDTPPLGAPIPPPLVPPTTPAEDRP